MTIVHLQQLATDGRLLGARPAAFPIRDQIEQALQSGDNVVIDFAGIHVTQSFVDELIGVLVMQRGKAVLSSLTFKNCSSEVKAILHFVVSDRLDQRGTRELVH